MWFLPVLALSVCAMCNAGVGCDSRARWGTPPEGGIPPGRPQERPCSSVAGHRGHLPRGVPGRRGRSQLLAQAQPPAAARLRGGRRALLAALQPLWQASKLDSPGLLLKKAISLLHAVLLPSAASQSSNAVRMMFRVLPWFLPSRILLNLPKVCIVYWLTAGDEHVCQLAG